MTAREREQLDAHITGNYGEDQMRDDDTDLVNEENQETLEQFSANDLLQAAEAKLKKELEQVNLRTDELNKELGCLVERRSQIMLLLGKFGHPPTGEDDEEEHGDDQKTYKNAENYSLLQRIVLILKQHKQLSAIEVAAHIKRRYHQKVSWQMVARMMSSAKDTFVKSGANWALKSA